MNQPKIECPACEEVAAVEQTYDTDLTYKGAELHVVGLLQMHCAECGYSFETHDQHDLNVETVKQLFLQEREEYKRSHGLLTGAEIRKIRKDLGLNQQPAAKLFGGGLNAFSKYENEEVMQATSMDRLIRLVSALGRPGVELLRSVAEGEATNNFALTVDGAYWLGTSTAKAQLVMAELVQMKQVRTYDGFRDLVARSVRTEQATTSNANNVTVELVRGGKMQQLRPNPVTGAYYLAAGE